jgi:dethiobiotin synthetase
MNVFITGTDTGAGKTHFSAAVLRACGRRGVAAIGMKPIASGAEQTSAGWHNDDVAALRAAAPLAAPDADINPYLFALPASPHIAAAAAGVAIDIDVIDNAYRRCAAQAEVVVVEGVGGWLVPVTTDFLVADLAARLALPVVMVVGVRLGCINHALLTAGAIADSGRPWLGYVANIVEPEIEALPAVLETLQRHLPAPCLGVVNWRDDASLERAAEALTDLLIARPDDAARR